MLNGVEQGLEGELDSNAEILPARAQKVEAEEGAAIRKISKGEQRKLKQIAREKAMKAQREQVTSGNPPYERQCYRVHQSNEPYTDQRYAPIFWKVAY